jgi:hypothetical protein
MNTLVVAHYTEDLDWLKNISNMNIKVISRKGVPPRTPPNKGNEASAYLEYIIQNYDTLSDYTVFVHGHRSDWHHLEPMDKKLNRILFDRPYRNINELGLTRLADYPQSLENTRKHLPGLHPILGSLDIDNLYYKCSAQFYVTRDAIRARPLSTYIQLYNYIMDSNIDVPFLGTVFEYLWHILFTGSLVDKE